MNTSYTPLMNVILAHPYFGNDGCPVVDLIPTSATQQIMKRLMIRSVKRDKGIELFSGSNDGQPTGLETIETDEVVQLFFILRTNDPTFLNYTNLPASEDSLTQIAYLTNLEGNDLSLDSENRYPLKTLATSHDGLIPGDLGLLSIYLEKGAGTKNDITVKFANRETRWRYFIIEDDVASQRIFITDQEDNEMPFDLTAPDGELPNGITPKLFVSVAPIPLLRHYPTHHKLHLVKTIDERETKSSIVLPNADSNRINYQLFTDNEGNEQYQYFSDIHIYV